MGLRGPGIPETSNTCQPGDALLPDFGSGFRVYSRGGYLKGGREVDRAACQVAHVVLCFLVLSVRPNNISSTVYPA